MGGEFKIRSTREVARELGIDRNLLGCLVRTGIVKSTRIMGRSIVWPPQAIREAQEFLTGKNGQAVAS